MHKKLEAELVSLAHSILQMKNKENVNDLRKKALAIYEKLSVLKFVESYVESSLDLKEDKEELIDEIEHGFTDDIVVEVTNKVQEVVEIEEEIIDEEPVAIEEDVIEEEIEVKELGEEKEVLSEEEVEELFETKDEMVKDDENDIPALQFTLEEEFKDAISADVATQLFEKATKENPVIEEVSELKQRSLNDTLFTSNLQVGLNDRIAFVKHLFDGSQEDFNRVLSQLNSFKTEIEAKNFVDKLVKPDYDWSSKEEYEHRLIIIIQRKFL